MAAELTPEQKAQMAQNLEAFSQQLLDEYKKISPDGYNALVSKANEAAAAGVPGATGEAGIRSVIPSGGSATGMLSSLFGPGGMGANSAVGGQPNPLSSLFGGNQQGFQSLLGGGSMPGMSGGGGGSGMGGLAGLLGGMGGGGGGGASGGMGGLGSLLGGMMGGGGGGSSGGAASLLGSLFGMREGGVAQGDLVDIADLK